MSLTVVGSVALDSVKTPYGSVEKAFGGSATYASISSSYFTTPHIVGVVGNDYYNKFLELLSKRNVVTDGLISENGETFQWEGEYKDDMNDAITHDTRLNVFANFKPVIPEGYHKNNIVFLGNISPSLQLDVLKQSKQVKIKAADTMNFWISNSPKEVWEVVKNVNILFVNHHETLMLCEEQNINRAAAKLLATGLDYLIIKKGEFGVTLYSKNQIFCAPAYPLSNVMDPTGAGDCFAGGFLGYLSENMPADFKKLKKACLYGTAMASFNIENFSVNNMLKINREKIEKRYNDLIRLCDTGDIK